jgi:hypothetical protein
MQASLKKISVAAFAALSIAAATVATSSSANARPFHGGFHGGGFHHGGFHHGRFHRGFGPAFVGGLAFGALAAPYAWDAGYYYDDCAPRRRIVGYTPWGRPIVRFVNACY